MEKLIEKIKERFNIGNVNPDIVNYVVPTHKLSFGTSRRVVLIADLHGYFNDAKKSQKLIEAIREQNPHHIVVAGDFLNAGSGKFGGWSDNKAYENLCRFIKELSEVSPVVLSQGNHDVSATGALQEEANQRFMDLATLNPGRIWPLRNDRVVIDEFEILGFTPTHDVIADTMGQVHGYARDRFVEQFKENGVEIEGGDDRIVEFAGHNPFLFGAGENDTDMGPLNKVDISDSGHQHNNYRTSETIRKNPDKYLDGKGWTESFMLKDRFGKLILSSIRPLYRKVDLGRGVIYIDNYSQRSILQLRNGHFFKNELYGVKKNKTKWVRMSREEAIRQIIDNKYKALIISGGVNKFTPIPRKDDPEVTVVDYMGYRGKEDNDEEQKTK